MASGNGIPRDPTFDATYGIMRDGYEYIWNRCRRLRSDAFTTRVMLQRAICIHGVDAARLFYDESKMERRSALPRRVVTSLFGKGAVHTLDDAAHRVRKASFLRLMSVGSLTQLVEHAAEAWRVAIRRWSGRQSIVLFDETARILTTAACAWAGVPLAERDATGRARDFVAMVDAFGGVGPRLWAGKSARARTERWLAGLVAEVRAGRMICPEDSALAVMAQHRDHDGALLDARTAAVELINVIRPTVAIAWFVTFAALALRDHPVARERIVHERVSDGGGAYADGFMQEVRRFYPFTPYLGAAVRAPFEWRGHAFTPGTLVLLDVYGMNHDPALWDRPGEFRPERFAGWESDPFTFIPQGGGDRERGHRCPGEWIVMHNTVLALHFLTGCMTYEVVPSQDVRISLRRMPTRPKSGMVLAKVRPTARLDAAVGLAPSVTAARESTEFLGVRRVEVAHAP